MANTVFQLPNHWIVEDRHLIAGLPVTADEFLALQSRLGPFYAAPGALSVTTDFPEDTENEIGHVRVEYEGPGRIVSELFLVMVNIHDEINADLIPARPAPDTSVPPAGLVERLGFLK